MRLPVFALLLPTLLLTGCSLSPTASPSPQFGVAIRGNVHGGQQAIVGAHVYLFAANTTGYGGNNIAPSASNASISLLTNLAGNSDSIGNYVLTDSTGNFSITGDYTCTSGQQVYLYALGGNPGAGTNSAAGLLASLGNCPVAGTFLTTVPTVWINEVSTVAAAYSFAGFASDATHVSSSGSALALTGIANAFATAGNLANISTGAALTTTPGGNGSVPQSRINYIANILASCVNSASSSSTACSTLFGSAMSAGSTGTTPTDTATAAINIAHNPGSNMTALYGISQPVVAFAPTLASKPNDLIVDLAFSSTLNGPRDVAVDAAGNVWVGASGIGSVGKFSPLGVVAAGSPFATGRSTSLAIDSNGNAWTASSGSVYELTPSGASASGSPFSFTGTTGDGLAFDPAGHLWIANSSGTILELSSSGTSMGSFASGAGPFGIALDIAGNSFLPNPNGNNIFKLSPAGVHTGTYTCACMTGPRSVAFDHNNNLWAADFNANKLIAFNSSGTPVSSSGYPGGGLSGAYAIAIDGDGNAWTASALNNAVSEFSNAGVALSPTGYFGSSRVNFPQGIAVDGSGNVWIPSGSGVNLVEFVGASAPVVTPIASATANNTLGTRP